MRIAFGPACVVVGHRQIDRRHALPSQTTGQAAGDHGAAVHDVEDDGRRDFPLALLRQIKLGRHHIVFGERAGERRVEHQAIDLNRVAVFDQLECVVEGSLWNIKRFEPRALLILCAVQSQRQVSCRIDANRAIRLRGWRGQASQ